MNDVRQHLIDVWAEVEQSVIDDAIYLQHRRPVLQVNGIVNNALYTGVFMPTFEP